MILNRYRHSRVSACVGVALVLTVTTYLVFPAPAHGQPPVGRRKRKRGKSKKQRADSKAEKDQAEKGKAAALPHFKKGIQLFNDGDYRKAIDAFEKAYALFPSPKIHVRIALCYKWLAQNLKALEYYERYLKETPEKPKDKATRLTRRKTEMEVKNLLKLVARIRVQMEAPQGAEVRLNGKLLGNAPLDKTARMEPGTATLVAMHKGYHPFQREVKIAANHKKHIKIKLIKIKPKVIKKTKVIKSPPIYKRWWFWTAIGALVAGGATGLGIGLGMREEKRELKGTPINQDAIGVRW
jgi:hypothetical protein